MNEKKNQNISEEEEKKSGKENLTIELTREKQKKKVEKLEILSRSSILFTAFIGRH